MERLMTFARLAQRVLDATHDGAVGPSSPDDPPITFTGRSFASGAIPT